MGDSGGNGQIVNGRGERELHAVHAFALLEAHRRSERTRRALRDAGKSSEHITFPGIEHDLAGASVGGRRVSARQRE